MFDVNALQRS